MAATKRKFKKGTTAKTKTAPEPVAPRKKEPEQLFDKHYLTGIKGLVKKVKSKVKGDK